MRVHVIENFMEDPIAEREKALASTYKTVEHNGLNYRGISLQEDKESYEKIQKVFGFEKVTFECFYRRYMAGEENETYIHNDSNISTITGVLFLNEPSQCRGGTAFWKHKLYGWDCQPTKEEIEAKGLRDTKELWDKVYQDGFEEFKWQMTDYVPLAFNRLILFGGKRFHSRYPKEAFGTEIGNARLVKVFFMQVQA